MSVNTPRSSCLRASGKHARSWRRCRRTSRCRTRSPHANLCGFGKSVIQAVLQGKADELVMVNCCDSMRRVYDIVASTGKCKFLYMLDLPHDDNECEKEKFAAAIRRLKEAYEKYSGKHLIKLHFSILSRNSHRDETIYRRSRRACQRCPGRHPSGKTSGWMWITSPVPEEDG